MIVDREELAWAAGFIDGEGCFTGYYKGRAFCPHLAVGQVHREPLERLKHIFGTGTIIKVPKKAPVKDQFLYKVCGFEMVQAVLAALWIWLGPVKRTQAMSVLLKHRDGPHRKGQTNGV